MESGVVVVVFVVACLLDMYTWAACAMSAYVQNANAIYICMYKVNTYVKVNSGLIVDVGRMDYRGNA